VDVVKLTVPYEFIRDRTLLNWREVHFGLVHELLDPAAVGALARDQASKLPDTTLLEIFQAVSPSQRMQLVKRLADDEPQASEQRTRGKWLFLVLAWLYVERERQPDALQRVEEVFADFGYPAEVAPFVRYMPMAGPDLGSQAANEQRLLNRWKMYIDQVGPSFAA
jgi:hypothetical protein